MRPINRLPPEIFSSIGRKVIGRSLDASELFPLTHVCQRWRESLISIPENWTLISNDNEDIAAVSLRRAKAAPLKIILFTPSPSKPYLFPRIIQPYVQNTRSLSAELISTVEQVTATFPNFPQSMPMLESLELEAEEEEGDWSIDPFQPGFTPNLKRLSLTAIPLYPSLLGIRTLTDLTLHELVGDLRLDTLLDFLEGNNSLESADLSIEFTEPPPRSPQRRVTKNQLRNLSIRCEKKIDAQALITTIPLRRGASLKIEIWDENTTLIDTLPNVSTAHILGPPSPTSFQFIHRWSSVCVLLRGPSGKFSFFKPPGTEEHFPDYHLLPLTNVREFRLECSGLVGRTVPDPPVFYPPLFPSLETLTIQCNLEPPSFIVGTLAIQCNPECRTDVRRVLSSLLSNPISSPLLKNLAFFNCALSEELMEEITKFASERKKTLTSTWIYRVLIVHQDGKFPSATSIQKLRQHVSVVDIWMKHAIPEDLT